MREVQDRLDQIMSEDRENDEGGYYQQAPKINMNKKIIDKRPKTVTDAGHGINGDRGNVPFHKNGDEASTALAVESQTASALEAMGAENTRTRTEEYATSPKEQIQTRVDIFKASGANILVSHHLNCEKTCTNDILIMYHPVVTDNGKDGASEEYESNSLTLASYIKMSLEGSGLFTDRQIRIIDATRPNVNYNTLGLLRMIDASNNAAVLIELGNTKESNINFLTNNSQQIGVSIAIGVWLYSKTQQTIVY